MGDMFSIRMRASKRKRGDRKRGPREIHISGAEGLYAEIDPKVLSGYVGRAMSHPKGAPDRVVITIEKIGGRMSRISALPVVTLDCRSVSEAERAARRLLLASGISQRAILAGFRVVRQPETMRGAALVCAESGRRVEPDRRRGVRASCFGIASDAAGRLRAGLSRRGINSGTVKEALLLASKVASVKNIRAELCISDDPDYTTGYVSSRRYGYIRIPHLKRKGTGKGGRVFFVKDGADPDKIISTLQGRPAMVDKISACHGLRNIDEVLGRNL